MDLKITSVHNHGDFEEEHVLLEVTGDCDVGRYLLADSTYTADGKVSNRLRHLYWFPDRQVKRGERVSLWTKKGENTTATLKDGTKVHRFFWNLETAIWNDSGDCAVLIEAKTWQFFRTRGS